MKQFSKISFAFTFFAFLVSNVSLLSQFGGGDGTVIDPYQISTAAHLELIADSVRNGNNWSNGKYFIVTNDITDSVRTMIGGNEWYYRSFQGNFDGGGHTITLAIDRTGIWSAGYSALFGSVFVTSSFKNIIVDGYVNGYVRASGIIVYIRKIYDSTTITINNCINNAKITADEEWNSWRNCCGCMAI